MLIKPQIVKSNYSVENFSGDIIEHAVKLQDYAAAMT